MNLCFCWWMTAVPHVVTLHVHPVANGWEVPEHVAPLVAGRKKTGTVSGFSFSGRCNGLESGCSCQCPTPIRSVSHRFSQYGIGPFRGVVYQKWQQIGVAVIGCGIGNHIKVKIVRVVIEREVFVAHVGAVALLCCGCRLLVPSSYGYIVAVYNR
jgi:hypothetical protein